ncbi:hypothetical protein O3M35_010699 [Rhynocoris fuscipes]|uniref:Rad60/SUMO-like domain-containing protein n=1 Tax=Rhynocoris fuscipes TaxID=488301 RepID=A0AAW1D329_9HEMI
MDDSFRRITRSITGNSRNVNNDPLVYVDSSSENKKRTRSKKKNAITNREKNKEVLPVEVIDLMDSPVNDFESNKKKKKIVVDDWIDITLDSDSEAEETEPLVEVKALWHNTLNKIERFSLKRSDPLLPIFEHFAKINNVGKDNIRIITNNYTLIHQYDSIDTLKLKVTNFLIASLIDNDNGTKQTDTTSNENMIEIKCQFKDRKKPLLCRLHRNQPISAISEQCAHEVGCDLKDIKLYFDGDLISFNDTPMSLEFEGGECVDVTVVRT